MLSLLHGTLKDQKKLGLIALLCGLLTLLIALIPIDISWITLGGQTSPGCLNDEQVRQLERLLLSLASALSITHFLSLREASDDETKRHNWLHQFPTATWKIWITENILALLKRGKVLCVALATVGIGGAFASGSFFSGYATGHECSPSAPEQSLLEIFSFAQPLSSLLLLVFGLILVIATIAHATALAAVVNDFLQLRNRKRAIYLGVVVLVVAAQFVANNPPSAILAKLIAQDKITATELSVSLLSVFVMLLTACQSRCRWGRPASRSRGCYFPHRKLSSTPKRVLSPWLRLSWTASAKQVVSTVHLLAVMRHRPLACEALTAIILGPILLYYNFDLANSGLSQTNRYTGASPNAAAHSIALATVLSYSSVGLLLITTRVSLGILPWFLHDHRWLIRMAPNGEAQAVSGLTIAWVTISATIVIPPLVYAAFGIGLTSPEVLTAVMLTLAANYLTVNLTAYAGVLLKGASCSHPHDVAQSVTSSVVSVALGFVIGSLNAVVAIAINTPTILFSDTTRYLSSPIARVIGKDEVRSLALVVIVMTLVAVSYRTASYVQRRCGQRSLCAVAKVR